MVFEKYLTDKRKYGRIKSIYADAKFELEEIKND